MKRCVIIGAAKGFSRDIIRDEDFIISADGGYKTCAEHNITPGLIIGDFDSYHITKIPADINKKILPAEKDITDLQAAIDAGLELQYNYFVLTGCSGGRVDHFLAAVYMLEYLYNKGADGELADGDNLVFFHSGGSRVFYPAAGYKYISVLPLDDKITGVSVTGLKYPLKDAVIRRADTLGVSNEFIETKAEITIKTGGAFIIYSKDKKCDI